MSVASLEQRKILNVWDHYKETVIVLHTFGLSQLFDLLEICSNPPGEREITRLRKALRHAAAFLKGYLIFYVEQLR